MIIEMGLLPVLDTVIHGRDGGRLQIPANLFIDLYQKVILSQNLYIISIIHNLSPSFIGLKTYRPN